MHLGERCDEIVRLIEQTLADLEAEPGGDTRQATVTPLPTVAGDATPAPRAAAGF